MKLTVERVEEMFDFVKRGLCEAIKESEELELTPSIPMAMDRVREEFNTLWHVDTPEEFIVCLASVASAAIISLATLYPVRP